MVINGQTDSYSPELECILKALGGGGLSSMLDL